MAESNVEWLELGDDMWGLILRACTMRELLRCEQVCHRLDVLGEPVEKWHTQQAREFWNHKNVKMGGPKSVERCKEVWKRGIWAARRMAEVAPKSLVGAIADAYFYDLDYGGHPEIGPLPQSWMRYCTPGGGYLQGVTDSDDDCSDADDDEPDSDGVVRCPKTLTGAAAASAIMEALSTARTKYDDYATEPADGDNPGRMARQDHSDGPYTCLRVDGGGKGRFSSWGCSDGAGGRLRFFRIGDDVFAGQVSGWPWCGRQGRDGHEFESDDGGFIGWAKVFMLAPGQRFECDTFSDQTPRLVKSGEENSTCETAAGDLLLRWCEPTCAYWGIATERVYLYASDARKACCSDDEEEGAEEEDAVRPTEGDRVEIDISEIMPPDPRAGSVGQIIEDNQRDNEFKVRFDDGEAEWFSEYDVTPVSHHIAWRSRAGSGPEALDASSEARTVACLSAEI